MFKELAFVLLLTTSLNGGCLKPEFYTGIDITPLDEPKLGVAADFSFGGEWYASNGGICVNETEAESYWSKTKEKLIIDQRDTMQTTYASVMKMADALETMKGRLTTIEQDQEKIHEDLEKTESKLRKQYDKLSKLNLGLRPFTYFDSNKLLNMILGINLDALDVADEKDWDTVYNTRRNNMDPRYKDKTEHKECQAQEKTNVTNDEIIVVLENYVFTDLEGVWIMMDILADNIHHTHQTVMALDYRRHQMMVKNHEILDQIYEANGWEEDGFAYVPESFQAVKFDFSSLPLQTEMGNFVNIPNYPQSDTPMNHFNFCADSQDATNSQDANPQDATNSQATNSQDANPQATNSQASTAQTRLLEQELTKKIATSTLLNDYESVSKDLEKYDRYLQMFEKIWPHLEEKSRELEEKLQNDERNKEHHGDNYEAQDEEGQMELELKYATEDILSFLNYELVQKHATALTTLTNEAKEMIPIGFHAFMIMKKAFEKLRLIEERRWEVMNKYYDEVYGDAYSEDMDGEDWDEEEEEKKTMEFLESDAIRSEKSSQKSTQAKVGIETTDTAATDTAPTDTAATSPVPVVVEDDLNKLFENSDIETLFAEESKKAKDEYNAERRNLTTAFRSVGEKIKEMVSLIEELESTNQAKLERLESVNANLAKITDFKKSLKPKIKALKKLVNKSDSDLATKIDAIQQIDVYNHMWKEVKKVKNILKKWKEDIEKNNSDIPKWGRMLKKYGMRHLNMYKLDYFQMDLDMKWMNILETMGGQTDKEWEKLIKEIESIEIFLQDNEQLLSAMMNEDSRAKCYESQFVLMGGVLMAASCGKADDYIKFDATGAIESVPVDTDSVNNVVGNCIDILFSYCAVMDTLRIMKQASGATVDKDFSNKSRACNHMESLFNCTIDFEKCDDKVKSDLFLANYAPFVNSFKNSEDITSVEASALGNLDDKKKDLKVEEDEEMNTILDDTEEMTTEVGLEFDGDGAVTIGQDNKTNTTGKGVEELDDKIINVDTELEEEEEEEDAGTIAARLLGSASSAVRYDASSGVSYKYTEIATKSGVETVSNESTIKGLTDIGANTQTQDEDTPQSSVMRMITSTFLVFSFIFMM